MNNLINFPETKQSKLLRLLDKLEKKEKRLGNNMPLREWLLLTNIRRKLKCKTLLMC